jgi:hypothetical protein
MKTPIHWILPAVMLLAASAEPLIAASTHGAGPSAVRPVVRAERTAAAAGGVMPPYPAPQVDESSPVEDHPATF